MYRCVFFSLHVLTRQMEEDARACMDLLLPQKTVCALILVLKSAFGNASAPLPSVAGKVHGQVGS
jgi:hypothetical protein